MIKIEEFKSGRESYYVVIEEVSGLELSKNKIQIRSCIVEKNNKQYYLIYDSNMKIISSSYLFLNHNMKKVSQNTKRQEMYALKYLFAFSEIINIDIKEFSFENFVQFIYFLKGISSEGDEFIYHINTKRSNDTINIFFSTYREFFKFLGYNKSPLFNSNSISGYIPKEEFALSKLIQSKKKQEVPKYISQEEFKKIIKYIREHYENKEIRLRNECLVRIMYEGGCRLGEVLGSTLEDYVVEEVNGEEICFVYIRNRISDKRFQNAKTCMNIHSKRTYESNDYSTKGVGYQLTFLNMDTYDTLCEYIDLAHDRAFKKCKKEYEKAKTDSVGSYKENNEDNYYLFLNNRGTPLSNTTVAKDLRDIFVAVGIEVDKGVKENNLAHRFRHGFVMHLIYDLKLPREKVMARSRHRSYSGLDAYYNPTTEDLISMKQEIEDIIIDERKFDI